MIWVISAVHVCCRHINYISKRRFLRKVSSRFGVDSIMSGPGPSNKGKALIQSKLSFASTSSANSKEKLPAENPIADNSNKGAKRKPEADYDMDPNIRKKTLEAAEKRRRLQNDNKVGNSSAESPYFSSKSAKDDTSRFGTGASTSGARAGGDTQEYEMTDLSGSQNLFASDSEYMTDSQNFMMEEEEDDPSQYKKPSTWNANCPWKGKPLDKLNVAPDCLPPGVKLQKGDNHVVCIKLPFQYKPTVLPTPDPPDYRDVWDDEHVRMPCSSQNKYPVSEGSNMQVESRWEMIKKMLKDPITSSADLEKAILSYNKRYINKWNFTSLHQYFNKYLKPAESRHFFEELLPKMTRLALKLPQLCTRPMPLLKKGKAQSVTLSQQQVACLLANAFFCTFPRRNSRAKGAEFSTYPDINFNSLFQGPAISRKLEKMNCIIHYFRRVCEDMPKGVVTFSRQVLAKPFPWTNSQKGLKELHVSSSGTIEDDGIGMLQVDFANKYLGGGVLNTGLVQEEIRFMICPEMILSRLFTEVLGDMESLLMTGCEQFSEYQGYADSFKWKADFRDHTKRDTAGRLCCEVVAIDALVFRNNPKRQYTNASVIRELNKAYCGFMSSVEERHRAAVGTGNWGCGAFGGDKQIKSLIQMMAASAAGRDMCYFTFDDEPLTTGLHRVHQTLCAEEKTLREVLKLLIDYNLQVVEKASGRPRVSLFEFIHLKLVGDPHSPPTSSDLSRREAEFDEESNEAMAFTDSDNDDDDEAGHSKGKASPNYKDSTP